MTERQDGNWLVILIKLTSEPFYVNKHTKEINLMIIAHLLGHVRSADHYKHSDHLLIDPSHVYVYSF